ncbi:hypothetical protein KOI35_27000 [Actinoplanes bogorensis]|uniref:Uncharacterized protein n=1 Tax=Paractinoplanes bogorensis TaxID=1610840 RepID=A0ABS5YVQ8_9ACTN|nr:hypothetical protein [Actinoplanes bogorensis]MBU2667161.1 hypothetical protein [Actinoplanes bogorensis]
MLIRAVRGEDGVWRGSDGPPTRGRRSVLHVRPVGPYAGRRLDLDVGETSAPPGWTRFHLPIGTYYATDVVCWLLFGADFPGCWPPTRFCGRRCG